MESNNFLSLDALFPVVLMFLSDSFSPVQNYLRLCVFHGTQFPHAGATAPSSSGPQWAFTIGCINNGCSIHDVTHWFVDCRSEASSLDFGYRHFVCWSQK